MDYGEKDIYLRTFNFSLGILELSDSILKKRNGYILSNQLVRAGTSVGANLREAKQARSKSEFIAKLSISLQEAEEALYWLELTGKYLLIKSRNYDNLIGECIEIKKIISTIIQISKRK